MPSDGVKVSPYKVSGPEVAVIVPAFNPDRRLLEAALRSVVSQTLTDWEAVVVNDGSAEPLDWVREIDARILVVDQTNLGLPAARNRGIRETSAPLVAFLDADDVWLSEKLSRQVEIFRSDPSASLISTDFEHIDVEGHVLMGGYTGHNLDYLGLLGGCGIFVGTVAVRRSVLDELGAPIFRPLTSAEDWDLWLRLAERGNKFCAIDEVLAQYRLHGTNMTRNCMRILENGRKILEEHRGRAISASNREAVSAVMTGIRELEQRSGRQAFTEARSAIGDRDLRHALRHGVNALRLAPRQTFDEALGYLVRRLKGLRR